MRNIRLAAVALALAAIMPMLGAEREVKVQSAGAELAGTLTLPEAGAPRAVMVMATGSGRQDRDETLGRHKPFKAIADYLAGRGYATLRCDDRGTGGSTGDYEAASLPDFAADVRAQLAFLASELPGVRTGVLGHSEGGMTALQSARADSLVAFMVTIGCPAWSGDSIVMSQARAIATAATGSWEMEEQERRYLDIAKSDAPTPKAAFMLKMAIMRDLGDMAKIPGVEAQLDGQISAMLSPEYRAFLRYDPGADIQAVKVPWLALNGDLDMQVVPANLLTIKELNPQADTRLLPGHNHLLQRAKSGMPQEYEVIAEDISPRALSAIADWLDQVTGAK